MIRLGGNNEGIRFESTEESLKDVRPLFSEEEINMLWENKRMKDLEREISIHKVI